MPEELEYIIKIAGLILKFHREELNEEESLELKVWCAQSKKNQDLFNRLSEASFLKEGIKELPDIQSLKKAGWEKVMAGIDAQNESDAIGDVAPVRKIKWMRLAAAACITGVLVCATWWFVEGRHAVKPPEMIAQGSRIKNDIAPGGDKAVLTLADGSSVMLDGKASDIAIQDGANVRDNGGALSYTTTSEKSSAWTAYNTLTTPAAGQYTLSLPDGSKVFLNNASSIRYPVVFSGKDRTVELHGEAYFEVAKNTVQPFHVNVGDMDVAVLGTSFNINAYSDESEIKTSLLTGGVRVERGAGSVVLKPGQQAQVDAGGKIKTIDDIDIDAVVAWKNGLFHFDRADIKTVMRMLARWYDVEVVYAGAIPNRVFGGDIQRNLNLSQVLEILQKNQVHFDLEGRRITVRP